MWMNEPCTVERAMPEVTRIMIATHQHAGLDGAVGDAHDWDEGCAHAYQGHDCLDAARGDAHDRDDVDAQGDQGLQKQLLDRVQQPIGASGRHWALSWESLLRRRVLPRLLVWRALRRRLSPHINQNR